MSLVGSRQIPLLKEELGFGYRVDLSGVWKAKPREPAVITLDQRRRA
jgi:hypothetical protein